MFESTWNTNFTYSENNSVATFNKVGENIFHKLVTINNLILLDTNGQPLLAETDDHKFPCARAPIGDGTIGFRFEGYGWFGVGNAQLDVRRFAGHTAHAFMIRNEDGGTFCNDRGSVRGELGRVALTNKDVYMRYIPTLRRIIVASENFYREYRVDPVVGEPSHFVFSVGQGSIHLLTQTVLPEVEKLLNLSETRFRAFLSHAWGNNAVTHELVKRIRDMVVGPDLRVWFDEDQIAPGADLRQAMIQGINDLVVW